MIIHDGTFFTALIPQCTQLTHLILDSVELRGAAAQESLGQLATGLPALQQLDVRHMDGAFLARHPQLLQRVTCTTGSWPQVLQHHAASFQRLRTLKIVHLPLATFSALRDCPFLTHIETGHLLPPLSESVPPPDSLPPAPQQLSITWPVSISKLARAPFIARVSAECWVQCMLWRMWMQCITWGCLLCQPKGTAS